MPELNSNIQTLVLCSALALSLSENGTLSSGQLFSKGFAPLEEYCNELLHELVSNNLISITNTQLAITHVEVNKISLTEFILQTSSQIKKLLLESKDSFTELRSLRREVTRCECIEYAYFYGEKCNLDLKNVRHTNPKLILLAMELNGDKINALLWRAIKNSARRYEEIGSTVEFDEITTEAFETFIKYKRIGINFDGYRRPASLHSSKLADILDLYLLPSKSTSQSKTTR